MSRSRARHGRSGSPTSLRLPREFLPKDWSFEPQFHFSGSGFGLHAVSVAEVYVCIHIDRVGVREVVLTLSGFWGLGP